VRPPKPNGTPKRWLLPTTMSAPTLPRHQQGQCQQVGRHGDEAAPPVHRIDDRPVLANVAGAAGYCQQHAEGVGRRGRGVVAHLHLDAERLGARAHHAIVCVVQSAETKKRFDPLLQERLASVIASAAAVASSSSDALAISIPVRSPIMVWKFSSASIRPCEISAWYGV